LYFTFKSSLCCNKILPTGFVYTKTAQRAGKINPPLYRQIKPQKGGEKYSLFTFATFIKDCLLKGRYLSKNTKNRK
jgi:hypothetical protein